MLFRFEMKGKRLAVSVIRKKGMTVDNLSAYVAIFKIAVYVVSFIVYDELYNVGVAVFINERLDLEFASSPLMFILGSSITATCDSAFFYSLRLCKWKELKPAKVRMKIF